MKNLPPRHAMARAPIGALGAAFAILAALLLAGCAGESDDDRDADRVSFTAPVVVTQARVLGVDADSGRCAGSEDPCFKDNPDILQGRRTLAPVHDLQMVIQSRPVLDVQSVPTEQNEITVATLLTEDSRSASKSIVKRPDWYPAKPIRAVQALGARVLGDRQTLVRLQLYDEPVNPANSFGLTFVTEDFRSGDFHSRGGDFFTRSPTLPPSNQLLAAVADFDNDGRDSVVFVAEYLLGLATPVVTDGKVSAVPIQQTLPVGQVSSMVVANFFGTGPTVAVTVPSTNATGPGIQVEFYAVDRVTQAIAKMSDKTLALTIRPGNRINPASARLVAGNFKDTRYDQLVVVFDETEAGTSGGPGVGMVMIEQVNGAAVETNAAPRFIKAAHPSRLLVDKGRFLASDAFEGLVLLQDFGVPGDNRITVNLIGFGSNFAPVLKAATSDGPKLCVYNLVAGNFDRRTTNSLGVQTANRSLQLGLAMGLDCANGISGSYAAAVWQVSPLAGSEDGSRLELKGTGEGASFTFVGRGGAEVSNPVLHFALAALDLQGRSLVLGEPKVLTIENRSQPSIILAAPPMHVDFIDGELTNFTAAPQGFFARYSFSSDSEAKASTKATTTWAFGAEESASAGITYGNCELGDCFKAEERFSAKQDLDGATASMRSSFSSQSLEIKQSTGFGDSVWYSDSTLTIYLYPVLGKEYCPADAGADCTGQQKRRPALMVAGPDSVHHRTATDVHLAWYQPPWMAGQVLSYPGKLSQLQKAVQIADADFKILSNDLEWFTDSSDLETFTTWRDGSSSGTSTELNQNYSFSNELSVYGKAGVEGEFAVEASNTFSLTGSVGFKNLSDAKTTLGRSTGLGITKQAVFATPQTYGYFVKPYIFSLKQPQTADSLPPADSASPPFGMLQTGYVVDLLADSAGSIWKERYGAAPDLAFLHPSRMLVDVALTVKPEEQKACLKVSGSSTNEDCAELAEKRPQRPRDNLYHWMRGLFVASDDVATKGQQLTTAFAGDKLLLQARVHNLSLARMPTGTAVKVRFHGMVWDTANNEAIGKSFVIGTASSGAVDPYNTDSDNTNWALLGHSFDTTRYAGRDLMFWAVTWMEDEQGKLVGELSERGLTAIPPEDIEFEGVARLEQRFGNNLGFFNQPFHVFAARPTAPAAAAAARRVGTRPAVSIAEVGSESTRLAAGKVTMVAARVKVGEFDLRSGLTVSFHDGDPASGGRVIGVQHQPFLRADGIYDFRVPFRSGICGAHHVHVVTGAGTRFEHGVRLPAIEVTCP